MNRKKRKRQKSFYLIAIELDLSDLLVRCRSITNSLVSSYFFLLECVQVTNQSFAHANRNVGDNVGDNALKVSFKSELHFDHMQYTYDNDSNTIGYYS